jgi:hypothetical protein
MAHRFSPTANLADGVAKSSFQLCAATNFYFKIGEQKRLRLRGSARLPTDLFHALAATSKEWVIEVQPLAN